jgi:hypothetical protein
MAGIGAMGSRSPCRSPRLSGSVRAWVSAGIHHRTPVAGAKLPLDHQHPLSGPVAHGVFAHFSHSRGLYEHRDRTRACRRTRANTNAGPGSKWERALLLAKLRAQPTTFGPARRSTGTAPARSPGLRAQRRQRDRATRPGGTDESDRAHRAAARSRLGDRRSANRPPLMDADGEREAAGVGRPIVKAVVRRPEAEHASRRTRGPRPACRTGEMPRHTASLDELSEQATRRTRGRLQPRESDASSPSRPA